MTTFGASGAPGGTGGGEGARGGLRGAAVPHSPSPPPPRAGLLRGPPPPPCDKRRRECAEPTFTTTGTSRASLLNPVANGRQHRAGNVSRPAALPHHRAGKPCARALAREQRRPARGSTRRRPPGHLSAEPSRQRDSLPARVTERWTHGSTV
ncbi:phosphofurin acidic cluster sorting protein 1-like [Vulpes lagopus]|uniref:phosphofurin acidic cluster sorting protein 1-like n=1 Tax=Vulpes lagopus TaxID=494514 RepID=UPI001BC97F70|nr:phosphofurin acidic cluster sorting protein 1-like [Vulpes lagopus]